MGYTIYTLECHRGNTGHVLLDVRKAASLLLGISLYICSIQGFAETVPQVSLIVIQQIESSGRPDAVGDSGRALGLFQLHKCVIQDYNQAHKSNFHHRDALKPEIAKRLADWYLNKRIPALLKYFKVQDSVTNRLIAYNAGITTLVDKRSLPKVTKQYIVKYKQLGGSL